MIDLAPCNTLTKGSPYKENRTDNSTLDVSDKDQNKKEFTRMILQNNRIHQT